MADKVTKNEYKNASREAFFWNKEILWAAMLIGLALVFSYVRLIHFNEGGDVTWFSMFFLYLLGYFFGGFKGTLYALIFSLFKFLGDMGFSYLDLSDPILNLDNIPAEIEDYIFSYSVVALGGFFSHPLGKKCNAAYRKKYAVGKKSELSFLIGGYLIGMLLRYVSSIVNFVWFYSREYLDFEGNLREAAIYCLGYVGVETVLTVIFLLIPVVNKAAQFCRYVATNEYPFDRENI